MIDTELQNIINNQLSLAKTLRQPTENDISNTKTLIKIVNGRLNVIEHENNLLQDRIDLFIQVLKTIKLFNKTITFLFDSSDEASSDKNDCLTLCYTKSLQDKFITIPNHHILLGGLAYYLNTVKTSDINFNLKIDKTLFAGSISDFAMNIDAQKLNEKYELIDFKNCDVGKRINYLISTFYRFRENHHCIISSPSVAPIEHQLRYKYLINIDGQTVCWDRLYWQLYSNSLPIYIERDMEKIELYHELLLPNYHYVASSIDKINEDFIFYSQTSEGSEQVSTIINNGKLFVEKYFLNQNNNPLSIIEYIIQNI